MARFKCIFLAVVAAVLAFAGSATTFDHLTFVKTDGTAVSFAVEGLKITYDDFAHAVVANDETSVVLDLAEVEYMYFTNGGAMPHVAGDVNGDSEVNIGDVNAVVSVILGTTVDEDTALWADVNGDGEVNVADINALLGIIFGQ